MNGAGETEGLVKETARRTARRAGTALTMKEDGEEIRGYGGSMTTGLDGQPCQAFSPRAATTLGR